MIPPESCHVRVLVVALALVLRRRVESTNVSTVSVSLPTVAAPFVSLPTVAAADVSLSFVSASALGTIPDVSLNISAAPRRKRTLQSRPASTNIFPVDVGIDTIQKSQDRDGNESDTSYCTGDVRTDDST